MENKIHISILGMCVLRDIFTLGKKKEEEEYIVDRFVQSVSPITIAGSPHAFFSEMEIREKIENNSSKIFFDTSNFYKKMMLFNLYGNALDYLKEVKSDYLLLDMGGLRYNIWWLDKEKTVPITTDSFFEKYFHRMMNMGLFPKDIVSQEITTIDDATLYHYLDIFVERIKEMYPVDKIILFEVQGIYEYIDKNKHIFLSGISETERINYIVEKGYRYVKDKMSGCHIIRFPKGILCDVSHQWGKCTFHFIKEYYEYAYEAIDIVVNNSNNRNIEEVSLLYLKQEWEDKLYEKYYPMKKVFDRNAFWNVKFNNRRIQYIKYFEKWIIDNKIFELDGKKTVAFYGLSEIAKMLIKLCEMNGIDIAYIVEDGMKNFDRYKVISRNASEFPKADCMIISDLRIDTIKNKLSKMEVDFPVTDLYEIIGESPFLDISECY